MSFFQLTGRSPVTPWKAGSPASATGAKTETTAYGDGTFTRVTSGVFADDPVKGIGASWADHDNDGYLDLMVVNSATGQITADADAAPENWVFFAVTYDGTQPAGKAQFYFGTPDQAALSDSNPVDYPRGAVEGCGHLTLGNVARSMTGREDTCPAGSRVFRGLLDEVQSSGGCWNWRRSRRRNGRRRGGLCLRRSGPRTVRATSWCSSGTRRDRSRCRNAPPSTLDDGATSAVIRWSTVSVTPSAGRSAPPPRKGITAWHQTEVGSTPGLTREPCLSAARIRRTLRGMRVVDAYDRPGGSSSRRGRSRCPCTARRSTNSSASTS